MAEAEDPTLFILHQHTLLGIMGWMLVMTGAIIGLCVYVCCRKPDSSGTLSDFNHHTKRRPQYEHSHNNNIAAKDDGKYHHRQSHSVDVTSPARGHQRRDSDDSEMLCHPGMLLPRAHVRDWY